MEKQQLLQRFYDEIKGDNAPLFEDIPEELKIEIESHRLFAWYKLAVAYNEFIDILKLRFRKTINCIFNTNG